MLLLTSVAYNGIEAAIGPCDFRRTDDCYKKAITLSQIEINPENEDHVNEACQIFEEVFECLEHFIKKCLTPALQTVNVMLTAKSRQMLKKVCIHKKEHAGNVSCVEKALAGDDIKLHTELFLDTMEKVGPLSSSQKMPILCCGVENLFHTTIDKLKEACGHSNYDEKNSLMDLPVSRLRDTFCEGLDVESLNCAAAHSSSRKRKYGDLRIVKSMSGFIEVLIAETFQSSTNS